MKNLPEALESLKVVSARVKRESNGTRRVYAVLQDGTVHFDNGFSSYTFKPREK